MSVTMAQLDSMIDSTINRLASEQGTTRSTFHIDLRAIQQRITQKLVDQTTSFCATRGLRAERMGDSLIVTVDLNTCFLSPAQSAAYNTALAYTRTVHGNHL